MPKHVKEDPLGVFKHPFSCCKTEKNERRTLWRHEKIAKNKYHKAKKRTQKTFWSRAGLEPTSFYLADLKKAVTSMPSSSRNNVAQFSVSASQLIKLIKSVSSLVLKKRNKPGTAQVGAISKAQK